jgi:hypothetical protein
MSSFRLDDPRSAVDSAQSYADLFKTRLDGFRQLLQGQGIQGVEPYGPGSFAVFNKLPTPKQEKIATDFATFSALCAECVRSNISLRDGRKLLWKILPQLNLRPRSDLFEQINDDQVVEIYRPDFTQIFRNLRFLELCSYPVADLYTVPWTDLFERSDDITDAIMDSIKSCLATGRTIYSGVPDHLLYERSSPDQQVVKIQQGLFSPLLDPNGRPAAFVGTLKATVIGKHSVEKCSVVPV